MKERRFYKTLIGSCVLMLCMAVVMIFTVFQADASNESKTVKYEGNYTYSSEKYIDSTTQEKIAPQLEGYLFAGWYTFDGTTYNAVKNPQENTTYYAKFVPEEVLDIKAQVSDKLFDDDTTNDGTAAIRFVTSLDNSMSYQKVGFNIKKGSTGEAKDADTTDYVYRTLYAVGATDGSGKAEEYTPEDLFHSESYYFKTWTITNIDQGAYNTDVTVIPYWITLDGTRVEGTKAIKTVNLGRSWVYIDTEANSTDKEEYGTRKHPFTKLDSALDAVTWVEGKIIVKADKEISVPSDFKWVGKKVDGNVRNITVTGENGTSEYLDFDSVGDMGINDNVTFENIKLSFAKFVYANGNKFTIADTVELYNKDDIIETKLFGGAKSASVESTHLEIHAGTWEAIYGGGNYVGGDVSKDTNIYITNAKIFSNTKDSCMIVGGGRGTNTVGGNTNITVGKGFNENITVEDGHYSAIYGGGKESGSVVTGNTNVTIKDGAKVNFVYGGGASNTTVKGICNVTLLDGEVYSIWGGARGEDPSTAGKNEKDTVVKVAGGTVAQIIGGNGTGMTGNTYVEVLGGTVTRRIYGGCYHGSTTGAGYVDGTTTVVIGKGVTFDWSIESLVVGEKICAGSRYAGEQDEEVGILIFNAGTYDSNHVQGNNADVYDYLVKATEGGKVTTEDMMLCVTPVEVNPGTVTINDTVQYFKGAGSCELPEITETTPNHTVDVVFNATVEQSQIEACEARIDGMYYPTLENAIDTAQTRKNKPVVTLLNNVEVESTLSVEESAEFTIQSDGYDANASEDEVRYQIKGTNNSYNLFEIVGKLAIHDLVLANGSHGIYVDGGELIANEIEVKDSAGKGIYIKGGKANISGLTVNDAGQQGLQFSYGADVEISEFELNKKDTSSSNAAIYTEGSSNKVILTNGKITTNGYGIYVKGDKTELDAKGVEITRKQRTDANTFPLIYVDVKTTVTVDDYTTTQDGIQSIRESKIDGMNLEGRGVEVLGTFNLNGGTITKNKITNGSSSDLYAGAGVLVKEGANFTMNGGTISYNIADGTSGKVYGAGVALNGGSTADIETTFSMTGGSIEHNDTVKGKGAYGAGVALNGSNAKYEMSEGTIIDNGNSSMNAGGAVSINGGSSFVFRGGKIQRNTANNGGAIHANGGSMTMSGDSILGAESEDNSSNGNIAYENGGAIWLASNFSFTMDGGKIMYNKANGKTSSKSGGLYLNGACSVNLNAGEISGNTDNYASDNYCNVHGGNISASITKAAEFILPNGTYKTSLFKTN